MDIFEMAQQSLEIQEKEKEEKALEAEQEKKAKSYKVDIFEALKAVESKDYDWFNRLGENQKSFQPFILNMWMSMIWNKNSKQKKFTHNDLIYAEMIKNINYTLNRQLFQVPKEMFWLLACTIQEYDAPFVVDFKKSMKKTSESKYNKKVIDYMSQELFSSNEKILDMIDCGLITKEDMKAIEKDLDTIDNPSGKKKQI